MELREIPFISTTPYRIDREGRVFAVRATRPGRPPKTVPHLPLTRLQAEDAARRFYGGKRKPGQYFSLVAPAWSPPAGATPMAWCLVHRKDDPHMFRGVFIDAIGNTDAGWFKLELNPGTAIVHGPSIAVEAFKNRTGEA